MDMLQMVREVLAIVDGSTVPALDPLGERGASIAGQAQDFIMQANQRVQGSYTFRFHHFEKVDATPDATSKRILLTDDILHIKPVGPDAWRQISYVGRKLYDHDNNVDTFENPIKVTYKVLFSPECCPTHVQQWIVAEAAMNMILAQPRRYRDRQQMAALRLREASANARNVDASLSRHTLSTLEFDATVRNLQHVNVPIITSDN